MAFTVAGARAADVAQVYQIVSGAMSQPGAVSASVKWRNAGGAILPPGYTDSVGRLGVLVPDLAGRRVLPCGGDRNRVGVKRVDAGAG